MSTPSKNNPDSCRTLLQTKDATFSQRLRACLSDGAKRITIYFGPSDEWPDHIGSIDQSSAGIRYEIQGHGIAKTVLHPKNQDELLKLVMEHNRFLNLRDEMLVVSSECL